MTPIKKVVLCEGGTRTEHNCKEGLKAQSWEEIKLYVTFCKECGLMCMLNYLPKMKGGK